MSPACRILAVNGPTRRPAAVSVRDTLTSSLWVITHITHSLAPAAALDEHWLVWAARYTIAAMQESVSLLADATDTRHIDGRVAKTCFEQQRLTGVVRRGQRPDLRCRFGLQCKPLDVT